MATTAEIIKLSLQELSVLDPGEATAPDDEATVHELFKEMFQEFSNERLLIHGQTHETFSVSTVGAASSYTIGSSGVLNTVRPISITSIRISSGSYDYDLIEMSAKKWAAIPFKQSLAIPRFFYYNNTFPLGKIYFDSGTDTSQTIKIISIKQLADLPALASSVTFPNGYTKLFRQLLAVEAHPFFESSVLKNSTIRGAERSRNNIKNANYQPIQASMDSGLEKPSIYDYDIRSGNIF